MYTTSFVGGCDASHPYCPSPIICRNCVRVAHLGAIPCQFIVRACVTTIIKHRVASRCVAIAYARETSHVCAFCERTCDLHHDTIRRSTETVFFRSFPRFSLFSSAPPLSFFSFFSFFLSLSVFHRFPSSLIIVIQRLCLDDCIFLGYRTRELTWW